MTIFIRQHQGGGGAGVGGGAIYNGPHGNAVTVWVSRDDTLKKKD